MVGSMRGWRRMFHTTLDKVSCLIGVDDHIFHLIKQQFLPFSLNYHYLYVATSPGGCSVASCVGLASRLKKVSTRVESRNRLPHIERNCGHRRGNGRGNGRGNATSIHLRMDRMIKLVLSENLGQGYKSFALQPSKECISNQPAQCLKQKQLTDRKEK